MKKLEGTYFTKYRNKFVCIDSGISICLQRFVNNLGTVQLLKQVDAALENHLRDYTELYMQTESGFMAPIARLTSWMNGDTLCLSPHYSIDTYLHDEVTTWRTQPKSN